MTSPVSAPQSPALSIVIVALEDYSSIRRVVRFLRAQTIQSSIELIMVAPNESALASCTPDETRGFYSVMQIYAGVIDNREEASVLGICNATAPVVAIVEDHAYPEPEWSKALVDAHQGPWAAVGPAVLNGNPGILSWTNMLLAYGVWPPTLPRGEMAEIALHNASFKRDVLMSYGSRLGELLSRSGGLLPQLRADGHRILFEPAARIHHVNPSTLSATLALRVKAGRLYAATRASTEQWSVAKRMLYTVASPAIPAVRLATNGKSLFAGRRGARALPFVPLVLAGLVLDSAGQAVGYAFGPGDTAKALAGFEFERVKHVRKRDRLAMADR
jgi:hypothetical protein